MFTLREIAVALNAFVLLYCLLSALVATAWRPLKPLHLAQQSVAAILFALRTLPLAASVVITLALVVPSFQLLEQRLVHEGVGATSIALGVFALLLITSGVIRGIAAQSMTTRLVSRWLEGARPLKGEANSTITLQSRCEAPPLLLVGVRNPKVLISEAAVALLSQAELHIALKHEREHVKSRDNLKKLIFCFCPFPGMAKLESGWSQAAEMAADDAAVSNPRDAVDLAAALIKLSHLPVEPVPVCATGFVAGSLSQRVARLVAWDEASTARARIRTWYVVPFAVAASLLISIAYSPVLAFTHEVTEWLVW
jgi:beta-lactamase regulating signal transducer with metallopeptidase domain